LRASKLTEQQKGGLIKKYTEEATGAYSRIITRYPLAPRAADAKKRLQAMNQPVPTPTQAAIDQNRKEIESRGKLSMYGKVTENFKHGPDMSGAAKVGEPTLVDPKQASAPEMVRAASNALMATMPGANKTALEVVGNGATPPENAPTPRSDAAPGSEPAQGTSAETATANTAPPTTTPGAGTPPGGAPASSQSNETVPELGNDLVPAPATPPPPPAAASQRSPDTSVPTSQPAASSPSETGSVSANGPATGSSTAGSDKPAPPADTSTESSSKKKKKHIWPF